MNIIDTCTNKPVLSRCFYNSMTYKIKLGRMGVEKKIKERKLSSGKTINKNIPNTNWCRSFNVSILVISMEKISYMCDLPTYSLYEHLLAYI